MTKKIKDYYIGNTLYAQDAINAGFTIKDIVKELFKPKKKNKPIHINIIINDFITENNNDN